ncbi:hypothetical protein ACQ9ZG_18675 [Streptomyces araujoniae]|uniref:hypothetical protein n=1 Tax=Streptomyces sp. ZEA17I TaxID=2202516 RepID=UPI0015E85FBF|nr:hypothetical protein [Streptomyces sp. ZEA17I]
MILIERGGDLVAVPDDFDFGPVYAPRTMAFETPQLGALAPDFEANVREGR